MEKAKVVANAGEASLQLRGISKAAENKSLRKRLEIL